MTVGLFWVAILGALELVVRGGWVSPSLVPAPTQILAALYQNPQFFGSALGETIFCSLLGFGIAVVTATSLGLWVGLSKRRSEMIFPMAVFGQTVPVIALAPILVVYFGFGYPAVVAAAVIVCFFPILAASIEGIRNTPRDLEDVFQVAGVSASRRFWQLRVPACLPFVFQGLRVAAGLSVVGSVVGEFISGTGLGSVMDAARVQYKMDQLFGAVMLSTAWAWILIRSLDLLFPSRYRFRFTKA